MGSPHLSLEQRIRRLEDRTEIGELIARYGLAMDDRDMEVMPDLFTADVVIRSMDGIMNTAGREAAVRMFRERFKVLGPSNHFSHDRIVTFDEHDADLAHGLVLSHAEMNRKGMAMLAAMRYRDIYHRDAGRWRFRERELTFMYYVPAAEYIDALSTGLKRRNRAYDEPRAADWPETLASWRQFYGG